MKVLSRSEENCLRIEIYVRNFFTAICAAACGGMGINMTKACLSGLEFERLKKIIENSCVLKTRHTFTVDVRADEILYRLELRLKYPNEVLILHASAFILSGGRKLRVAVRKKALLQSLLSVYIYIKLYG